MLNCHRDSLGHVILGRAGSQPCRVLPEINISCCVILALMKLCFGAHAATFAQQTTETIAIERLPDVDGVANAYTTLRQWIDAFEAPKPSPTACRLPIP